MKNNLTIHFPSAHARKAFVEWLRNGADQAYFVNTAETCPDNAIVEFEYDPPNHTITALPESELIPAG